MYIVAPVAPVVLSSRASVIVAPVAPVVPPVRPVIVAPVAPVVPPVRPVIVAPVAPVAPPVRHVIVAPVAPVAVPPVVPQIPTQLMSVVCILEFRVKVQIKSGFKLQIKEQRQ